LTEPLLAPQTEAAPVAKEVAHSKLEWVEARADSWNAAADAIIQKLKDKGVARGQIRAIDAHNNGPKGDAIFSAHYSFDLPSVGPLDVRYSAQNSSKYGWATFYNNANAAQREHTNVEDIISITGSCNSGNKAVTYVFYYPPTAHAPKPLQWVEARAGSWNAAANTIINKLKEMGVARGQIVSIDAHNNDPDDDAIFSAHYCLDLPSNGTLMDIQFHVQNSKDYGWATFYNNASNAAKVQDIVDITCSCNCDGNAVAYVFYYFPPLKFVEARADSWEEAAKAIIQKLKDNHVARGQVVSIDAHNNGPDGSAIFSAFYNDLPGVGPLDIRYDAQNSGEYGWHTFYDNANNAQMKHANAEDIISITGSCNSGDSAVTYVFYTSPTAHAPKPLQWVEARAGSWNTAAHAIIQKLKDKGVARGQIVSIDAHNNSPDGSAIFSAHYSLDLPGDGALDIQYNVQNTSEYSWDTFYTNASGAARSEDIISITCSCNCGGSAVAYVFIYDPPTASQVAVKNYLETGDMQASAMRALETGGSEIRRIVVDGLTHEDTNVRRGAAQLLVGSVNEEDARGALIASLNDQDPEVNMSAVKALCQGLMYQEALAALQKVQESRKECAEVAADACAILTDPVRVRKLCSDAEIEMSKKQIMNLMMVSTLGDTSAIRKDAAHSLLKINRKLEKQKPMLHKLREYCWTDVGAKNYVELGLEEAPVVGDSVTQVQETLLSSDRTKLDTLILKGYLRKKEALSLSCASSVLPVISNCIVDGDEGPLTYKATFNLVPLVKGKAVLPDNLCLVPHAETKLGVLVGNWGGVPEFLPDTTPDDKTDIDVQVTLPRTWRLEIAMQALTIPLPATGFDISLKSIECVDSRDMVARFRKNYFKEMRGGQSIKGGLAHQIHCWFHKKELVKTFEAAEHIYRLTYSGQVHELLEDAKQGIQSLDDAKLVGMDWSDQAIVAARLNLFAAFVLLEAYSGGGPYASLELETAVKEIFDRHRNFPEHVKYVHLGPVNIKKDKVEDVAAFVRFALALGWPEAFGNRAVPLFRGFLVAVVAELKTHVDTATMAQNKLIGICSTIAFTVFNLIYQKMLKSHFQAAEHEFIGNSTANFIELIGNSTANFI